MNTFRAVDDLGDMVVDGDARDHVGLLTREMRKLLCDEIDRFPHRDLHCVFEVGIESHDDPMGWGLRPRPDQLLAQRELEFASQSGLDGGQIHFTVPLAAWASPAENNAPGAWIGM